MKKRKKRRAKRVLGNDRGLMMICRDIRRRWMQYGENRIIIDRFCPHVVFVDNNINMADHQIDHISPMGPRPRTWDELTGYARRMFENDCQILCKRCHLVKTNEERERRKK